MSLMKRNHTEITITVLGLVIVPLLITPARAEYNPELGRFLQRDPHETALVLADVLARNAQTMSVLNSVAACGQYGDGLNLYQYTRSNPIAYRDPSGQWTYLDTLITVGLIGGLYGLAHSYSHYSDEGSPWKLAASFAIGAGMGVGAAMGFGWLSGALAAYAGISPLAAAASIGLMTSPGLFGYAAYRHDTADNYADRVMAGIDMGLAGFGIIASHAAAYSALGSTAGALQFAANRALTEIGPGSGKAHGRSVHTIFAKIAKSFGRSDLHTEVSYKGGKVVSYGKLGSIRVDVVEGTRARPIRIFELKTGNATLTQRRITQIRSHLPEECKNIEIIEIKPD